MNTMAVVRHTTSIEDLPDEVLALAFEHVQRSCPMDLLLNVVRVCQRWAQVSQAIITLRVEGEWYVGSWVKNIWTQTYHACLVEACRFKIVEAFRAYKGEGVQALLATPNPGTRLKFLDFSYTNLTDIFLATVAKMCKGLTTLNVEGCHFITDAGLRAFAAAGAAQLTTLNAPYCQNITDASLRAFAAAGAFPLLTTLDLKNCDHITDVGLSALAAAGAFPRLTTLSLTRCYFVTDAGLAALATAGAFPMLTFLDLALCDRQVTDAGLAGRPGRPRRRRGLPASHHPQLELLQTAHRRPPARLRRRGRLPASRFSPLST